MDKGGHLVYTDIRRFGTMYLAKDTMDIVGKMGAEPLDKLFTPQYLAQLLKSRETPVKSVLLNQELIVGIGNMYADEALFHAKIHPRRAASSLTSKEIDRLHTSYKTCAQQRNSEAWRQHSQLPPSGRRPGHCPYGVRSGAPGRRTVPGMRDAHRTHRSWTARYILLP